MNIRHKFNAIRTEVDEIKFASKKEAEYYTQLRKTIYSDKNPEGTLLFFLRQVPLDLPGGIKYICDFVLFNLDGSVHFIDVKGYLTKEFKLKRKLVEKTYPFKLELV